MTGESAAPRMPSPTVHPPPLQRDGGANVSFVHKECVPSDFVTREPLFHNKLETVQVPSLYRSPTCV